MKGLTTLPERFALRERLGGGASGEVYAAWDQLLRREVALKILTPASALERSRARREVAALLTLDLPGVVHLLDHAEHEGRVLLVMERVVGQPFPARSAGRWEALAPLVDALLLALAGVHAAGLVHRDLKPENVLVEPSGRVVLLDFGLARGSAAGADLTRVGVVVGTPRYLAPEQLSGEGADARADLYAVGVMIYEALAGTPPHRADSLSELWRARLLADAPSLSALRPDLPEPVIRAVDRLLARVPSARFSTAEEARAALCGAAPWRLPWLGDTRSIAAGVSALARGGHWRVGGPQGSGRTRTLEELALQLGDRALWLPSADLPLGSLAPQGRPPEEADADHAQRWAQGELAALRAAGRVLFADAGVDPWTRAALLEVQLGAVVVPEHEPAEHRIKPLQLDDLRALFRGPDRFLHLPEDAARLMLQRSEGHPGRVVDELSRWLSEGLARWEEGRIALDREGLERLDSRPTPSETSAEGAPLSPALEELLAWMRLGWPDLSLDGLLRLCGRPRWELLLSLEHLGTLGAIDGLRPRWPARALQTWSAERRARAEEAVALALPPGAPGRLRRLLAAGSAALAAEEACLVADQAWTAGRPGPAIAALRHTVRLVQREPDAPGERSLLERLVPALIDQEDARSQRMLDYELARAGCPVADLAALAHHWAQIGQGHGPEALAGLEGLRGLSGRAEGSRQAARAAAAQQLPVEEHDAYIMALLDEIPLTDPMRAQAEGWRGLVAYRRGDFAGAATLHTHAAARRPEAGGRLSSLLNAAGSALEACDLAGAQALAGQAVALAAALRAPAAEAWAAMIARSAQARAGEAETVDILFLQDLQAVGVSWLWATATATEAALAWRLGDRETSGRLARAARAELERLGMESATLYTQAIAAACAEDLETLAELAARARTLGHPEIGLDLLALAAALGVAPRDAPEVAQGLAARLPEPTWAVVRGVYSPREALGRVRAGGADDQLPDRDS